MPEPITLLLPHSFGPTMESDDMSDDDSSDEEEPRQILDPDLLDTLIGRTRSMLVPSLSLLSQSRDLTSEGHVARFLMLIAELALGENGVALQLPDSTPSRTRSAWEAMTDRFSADGKNLREFQQSLVYSVVRDGDAHIVNEERHPRLINSAAVGYPREQLTTIGAVYDRRVDRTGDDMFEINTGDRVELVSALRVIQIKHTKDELFRRGIPWIAPAIDIIKGLDMYAESYLTGADRANKMPIIGRIPSNAPPDVRDKAEKGFPIANKRIPFVPEGVTFDVLDIAKNFDGASYADVHASKMATVAAALGTTYDLASGDVSRANMSSLQSANLANQAFIKVIQRMIGEATKRMFGRWLLISLADRQLPAGSQNIDLTLVKPRLPRISSVIPHREAQVDEILIDAGVLSEITAMEERGLDPDEEIERKIEYRRRMGNAQGNDAESREIRRERRRRQAQEETEE